ncbi:CobW family GTP-binding protein [Sphingobium sp. R-21]|uniref:CobW family GTP-binding protein n=4 Tax=Sphingobium TaxID=165695 RepID=UPI003CECF6D5
MLTPKQDMRTPVTVLTGFLGSGKTTLLNRALRDPAMTRTAVIINEFGEIGIDHALTTASDDTIMVLENGCLCCTVFGDLIQTLNRLYHAREAGEVDFNHVVIETSGLAEAGPILQAFLSEPTLEGLFRMGAVVATVDAVNAEATLADHPVSVRQVALADSILLTKTDLLEPAERAARKAALIARLGQINRTAPVLESDDLAADPVGVMRKLMADPREDPQAAKSWMEAALGAASAHATHHAEHGHEAHAHDSGIASFNLIRDEPLPREALNLLLTSLEKHLGANLLRVKGLVNVREEPGQPAVIQGAQHLLHNLTWLPEWPDEDQRTRIVFITQDLPAGELEEMVTLLDRVAHRTALARMNAGGAEPARPI